MQGEQNPRALWTPHKATLGGILVPPRTAGSGAPEAVVPTMSQTRL